MYQSPQSSVTDWLNLDGIFYYSTRITSTLFYIEIKLFSFSLSPRWSSRSGYVNDNPSWTLNFFVTFFFSRSCILGKSDPLKKCISPISFHKFLNNKKSKLISKKENTRKCMVTFRFQVGTIRIFKGVKDDNFWWHLFSSRPFILFIFFGLFQSEKFWSKIRRTVATLRYFLFGFLFGHIFVCLSTGSDTSEPGELELRVHARCLRRMINNKVVICMKSRMCIVLLDEDSQIERLFYPVFIPQLVKDLTNGSLTFFLFSLARFSFFFPFFLDRINADKTARSQAWLSVPHSRWFNQIDTIRCPNCGSFASSSFCEHFLSPTWSPPISPLRIFLSSLFLALSLPFTERYLPLPLVSYWLSVYIQIWFYLYLTVDWFHLGSAAEWWPKAIAQIDQDTRNTRL